MERQEVTSCKRGRGSSHISSWGGVQTSPLHSNVTFHNLQHGMRHELDLQVKDDALNQLQLVNTRLELATRATRKNLCAMPAREGAAQPHDTEKKPKRYCNLCVVVTCPR